MIKVTQAGLADSLEILTKVVEKRSTIPIVSHYLITAANDVLRITVSAGDTQIVSRLVDGSYPDYARVIPNPPDEWTINTQGSLAAINRVKAVCVTDQSRCVHAEFETVGLITLRSRGKDDACAATDQIEAACVSGGNAQIAFNGDYLATILRCLGDGDAALKLSDARDPMRLTPATLPSGVKREVYVLMPVRA